MKRHKNKYKKESGKMLQSKISIFIAAFIICTGIFQNVQISFAAETENKINTVSGGTLFGLLNKSNNTSGFYLLKDFKLQKNENGSANDLKDGDIIYSDDDLIIQYNMIDLILNDIEEDDGSTTEHNVIQDGEYEFSVPEYLDPTMGDSWDVFLADNSTKLGTAYYIKDRNIIKLIMNNKDLFKGERINNAYVGFTAKLNKDKLNDSIDQTIDFGFGSSSSFQFKYGDKLPVDSTIEKTGIYDNNANEIKWTVTVKEGTKDYVSGVLFKDTLSLNQSYVENSFKVKIGDSGERLETPTVTIAQDGEFKGQTTLEYTYNPTGVKDTEVIFYYNTKADEKLSLVDKNDKVITGKITSKVSNKAEIIDKESGDSIAQAEEEINLGEKEYNWVGKEAGNMSYDGTTDTATTTWTINVNTNGFEFKNVVLYDEVICKPANSESEFKLVNGSLKIYKNNIQVPGNHTFNDLLGPDSNGKITWNYELIGDMKEAGEYKIEYQTQIKEYSHYRKYNQSGVKNTASITFEWPDYYGPGIDREVGIPSISKNAGDLSHSTIEKKYINYNASTHEVTWHIKVNEVKEDLDDTYYIKEKLMGTNPQNNDLKQQFIDTSDYKAALKNLKINGTAADNRISDINVSKSGSSDTDIEIRFNNNLLKKNMVEFDFVTKLSDEEIDYYQGNITNTNKRTVRNTAILCNDIGDLSSVNAEGKPENTVLEKRDAVYDYNTRTLTWIIEVNKSKIPLENVIVEDTILGSLDTDNIYVNGKLISNHTGNNEYFSYDESSKELKIYLGNISDTKTIQLKTHLEEDTVINDNGTDKKINSYTGEIKIVNEAVLKKNGSQDVKDSGSITIKNENLSKKGTIKEKGIVEYTIYMNKTQSTWPDNRLITDIMSSGMVLNLATVKLYEAQINAAGDIIQKDLVDKNKYTRMVTVIEEGNSEGLEAGSTKFEFTLPQNAGNKAYILTYEASLDEDSFNTNFTNRIKVSGLEDNKDMSETSFSKAELNNWGGGTMVSKSRVKIKMVNSYNKPLSGGVFALMYEGQVISVKTANAKGEITFSDLVPGENYTIKEITPPQGYELDTSSKEFAFTAAAKGDTVFIDNPEIFTYHLSASVSFTKKDNEGNTLSGALFGLFDETETVYKEEKALETAISNTAGDVLFEYGIQGIYQIAEISAPAGYVKSADILIVELDLNGAVINLYKKGDAGKAPVTEIINNKIKAIQFSKKDDKGNILRGAEFGLFAENADVETDTPIMKSVSDHEGKVTFENLAVADYQIAELKAPANYVKDSSVYIAQMNADGTVEKIYKKTDASKTPVTEIINTKIEDIIITKKSDNGSLLKDALFGLYEETADVKTAVPIKTAASGDDGKVMFTNLEAVNYQIAEISSPIGYVKSEDILFVEISREGKILNIYNKEDSTKKYVSEIINNEIKQIHIGKTDENGKPLETAVFGLYAMNADVTVDAPIETAVSDSSGNVIFSTKTAGEYKIAEIEAPKGYEKSKDFL